MTASKKLNINDPMVNALQELIAETQLEMCDIFLSLDEEGQLDCIALMLQQMHENATRSKSIKPRTTRFRPVQQPVPLRAAARDAVPVPPAAQLSPLGEFSFGDDWFRALSDIEGNVSIEACDGTLNPAWTHIVIGTAYPLARDATDPSRAKCFGLTEAVFDEFSRGQADDISFQ